MWNMVPGESAEVDDVPTLYLLLRGTQNHQDTDSHSSSSPEVLIQEQMLHREPYVLDALEDDILRGSDANASSRDSLSQNEECCPQS
ncbi:hypothetical protein E5288_WYG019342 [Bos mutus]|uniref:Uncharacterized protein n=1 Tax=Bos mutus TaxID=72004 RepID=A0A6B0RAK7_9CETA|nr:hypothetical protein [Bos mutus]